ncbi:uncharacterized protein PV09_09138 [Verruconis gallopava]|uniref:MYND-type domain-containing protein n=1 Tax=Verruconis gallopava TaxID=253628 RepID=A0A0D1XAG4_9PEZI|nr:uncharacterized protein PV09_09138 [Verruconis gallopava]KIV99185.1 hypothetical protein PV09_09138 [Verruconis gallopava]
MADFAGLFSDNCCAVCSKTTDLLKCGKCRSIQYCSKECQKKDWKTAHKALCGLLAQMRSTRTSESATGASASGQRKIDKPFHKLNDGTWLHGRSEKDVFQLLVDSFRLRLEDEHTFRGTSKPGSIYTGSADSSSAFKRYLTKVGSRKNLLPPWWNEEKSKACVAFGMKENQWSNLRKPVKKSEIIDYYGSPNMPMQMRMLAEDILGDSLSPGDGAKMMRNFQMMQEAGDDGLGDWKVHKKVCAKLAAARHKATKSRADDGALDAAHHTSNFASNETSCEVSKPFHALNSGTWLQGRSEEEVFKLLVDSWRLRKLEELETLNVTEITDEDPGVKDGMAPFRDFVEHAARKKLLPSWWTKDKVDKCVKYGLRRKNWSNLSTWAEKESLINHYGDATLLTQMCIFTFQALGAVREGEDDIYLGVLAEQMSEEV